MKLKPLFTWRSAICESSLPADVRHVALVLSLHMSERGDSCYPSLATLCRETGRRKETVVRAIATLEDGGWLEVRRSNGGRGRPNEYRGAIPDSATEQERSTVGTVSAEKGSTVGTVSPPKTVPGASENGPPSEPEDVIPRGRKESYLTTFGNSPARAAPKREPIWELLFALETGEAYTPSARRRLTRKAASALNAAAREIRETGISPDELSAAIAAWPRVMGDATCTAHGVAKHLPRLLAAARGVLFRGSREDPLDEIAARAEELYAQRRREAAGV